MTRLAPILVLLLVLPGCASDKGFLVSGVSIDTLGQQFVATAGTMNRMLDAKQLTAEQYKPWAAFAQHFKAVYPSLVQGWKDAVTANNAARQQDVLRAVTVLAGTLGQFVAVAMKGGA